MIIALTVGLSVASRTVTNLSISRQSEESGRAFQAAEAGVEQILQSGARNSSKNWIENSSSFKTDATYPSGQSFSLNGGELVDQAVGMDVWLSNYPDFSSQVTGSVTIYWNTANNQTICSTSEGPGGPASVKSALEVIVLYGTKLTPQMDKYMFDVCNSSRITTATMPTILTIANGIPISGGPQFQNSATITIPSFGGYGGLIMRVIPIFNSTKMAITSTTPLPKQGSIVESTGSSGQTVRKVRYFASYPQIPVEIFPYSLISQ